MDLINWGGVKMSREIEQQELLDDYKIGTSGIYLLSPRFGKTRLTINIIKKIKAKKILWVTPSVKLRDVDIPKEFIKWKAKTYLDKTKIITYHSLHLVKDKYDIVILDEIQEVTLNNTEGFFNGDITTKSILGLTGTMPKHEEKLDIINRLKLNIFKEITIDEAVDKGFVADYTVKVIECNMNDTDKTIKAGSKKKPFMTTEFKQYQYLDNTVRKAMFSNNQGLMKFAILNRMRAIYNSKTKENIGHLLLKTLKGRKLIFSGSIEQAERFSKNTYHSKTDDIDLNNFLEEKIDTLACVNAGGTGFTYKNVDHFIIVQSNSNKKGNFTQKMTRSILKQGDYIAQIWVVSLLNTKDEDWVANALTEFDTKKIEYINIKNLNQYIDN